MFVSQLLHRLYTALHAHLTHCPSVPGAPTVNLTAPMYVITPNPLSVSCRVASFPQSVVTVVVGQSQKMASPQVLFDSTASVVVHKTGDVEFTVDEYGSNDAVVTCMAAVGTEVRSSQPATVRIYGEEVHTKVWAKCVCLCVCVCMCVCVCARV